MTHRIVLDPSGENPVKEGHIQITTDIEFLRHDTASANLWIVGERLCQWVESIYQIRLTDFAILPSPRKQLRGLIGEAAESLDSDVVRRVLSVLSQSEDQPSLAEVLVQLTGEDMFSAEPSKVHAAQWLLLEIPQGLTPLAQAQAERWKKQCEGAAFAFIYDTPMSARENFIRQWLSLEENSEIAKTLGKFPIKLPPNHPPLKKYRKYWGEQLRNTQGACIDQFDTKDANAKEIGEVAYQYFRDNADQLTPNRLARIRPGLRENQRAKLNERIPVSAPQRLPADSEIDGVLSWATSEYLPYRRWQVRFASDQEETAKQRASSFAKWVLAHYPRLTNFDRETTPINLCVPDIVEQLLTKRRVLWVVVDGLSFINHRRLIELLAQTDAELRPESELTVLAVLPTITEMAKWGLVTGQFPSEKQNPNESIQTAWKRRFPQGEYVSGESIAHLKAHLTDAQKTLILWNITKLDDSYHRQTDPKAIENRVESALSTLVHDLSDAVLQSGQEDAIAVVITSDHGQLMGSSKPISAATASEIQTHGRAAYGSLTNEPIQENYRFVFDPDAVQLHPKSYRLPQPMTLAMGNYHFGGNWRTDSDGRAYGVHGGLSPEEMVVGIAVLSRQIERHPIRVTVEGENDAGKLGTMTVNIDNPNRVELRDLLLFLPEIPEAANGLMLRGAVPANKQVILEFPLQNWLEPTSDDTFPIVGTLQFTYPDGSVDDAEVSGQLTSRTLYQRKGLSLRGRFGNR